MIPAIRNYINTNFTEAQYQEFLKDLHSAFPGAIDFRVAETPVFVDKGLGDKMIATCEYIIDFIKDPSFKNKTETAIPAAERSSNEGKHPHFIAFDFGICQHEDGSLFPALIEMQGFPTLFGFQAYYPEVLEKHYSIPEGYSNYFNGLDKSSYISLLKKVILGECNSKEVILLELRPHQQKTRIDFYCTEKYLGIPPVCLTELFSEGNKLFYLNNGEKIQIKRIYNRVIADELNNMRTALGETIDLTKDYDVEWITHPHWFYRISKFTLPYLHHDCIPETNFLNQLESIPKNLEHYVLKPLFSFAGQGVIIDVTIDDIKNIKDPENWILQRKVDYAACIETPDSPAKVEIRLMYLWEENAPRPILATNLARLSKGKMIGVRYNADKDWVGGSVAYFKK
jgi:hypothetical protein